MYVICLDYALTCPGTAPQSLVDGFCQAAACAPYSLAHEALAGENDSPETLRLRADVAYIAFNIYC